MLSTILFWLALIITALASIATACFAATSQVRSAKRVLRFYESLVFLWLVFVYSVALTGGQYVVMARVGVILVSVFVICEVWLDWRRR